VSLTPIKVSSNGSGIVDPVDLATVEVWMSTEAKMDSGGSDACDVESTWVGLLRLIPINVTAVARALDALSRNSAKDLAPTSTHCDDNVRAVSICNCVVNEYSGRRATNRMNETSMISD